jgi:hypothetical protein
MSYSDKQISDAMTALGWTYDNALVCKHGGKPEAGWRRPIPDVYAAAPLNDAAAGQTGPASATGNRS